MNPLEMKYEHYPLNTYDKVRYCDTDRQGHVNNSVFNQFFETGRVELLFHPEKPLYSENCQFVIADLQVSLLKEITWPGTVEIGSVITKVGNSSMTIVQGLFQHKILVATSKTIIVQMNETTRKSHPLSEKTKEVLKEYSL